MVQQKYGEIAPSLQGIITEGPPHPAARPRSRSCPTHVPEPLAGGLYFYRYEKPPAEVLFLYRSAGAPGRTGKARWIQVRLDAGEKKKSRKDFSLRLSRVCYAN